MLQPDSWHESYLVRMWAETDGDELVLRGAIRNVQTGHVTYFESPELAAALLRESAERLTSGDERSQIA